MIVSRKNQVFKDMRRLRRSKGPSTSVLLEGPHLIGEAIDRGVPLLRVLATPEFLDRAEGRALADRLPREPLEMAADLLEEIADSDSPRGIVAVAVVERRGVEALPVEPGGVYVYAERIQDPGNLGALARVAEASGAIGLALGEGSANPDHPRALRASAGSLLRLPTAVRVDLEDLMRRLPDARSVALVPRDGRDLYDCRELLDETLVLMLGAEGPGLTNEGVRAADETLTIPLAEPVESLNVTTAAAIVLFELRRARAASQPAGTKRTRNIFGQYLPVIQKSPDSGS